MSEEDKGLVISKSYDVQLQDFENGMLEAIGKFGLPTQDILVPVPERVNVFRNVEYVLNQIESIDQKERSIYLSKFLAAVSGGLFDAALNYLWDETISELRRRVIQYDIEYFYDNATHAEKRKKLNGEEDITKLDDNELIQGSRNIGLISELGYKHLDYIRYMRNWASAAHPNQNQLTGLQLISWLETCIKEVISLPLSNTAIEIKKFLFNIKNNSITHEEARQIASFFLNLTKIQVNNLASGFFGIYTQASATPQARQNIHFLLPLLWDRVDEETRNGFGIKYGKFVANNDQESAQLSRQFLEITSAISYIPASLKAAEIETSIQNLLSAHRGHNNFYSEPVFARQLASLIGQTGSVPKPVERAYVIGLIEVYLTNGNGVAWNAEPTYLSLINNFDHHQSLIALLSFTVENISSRLQFSLCQRKFNELLQILNNKVSAPAVKELIADIQEYKGPLEKLENDSRIKMKVSNLLKIIGETVS
jgi:hypothetical protein